MLTLLSHRRAEPQGSKGFGPLTIWKSGIELTVAGVQSVTVIFATSEVFNLVILYLMITKYGEGDCW